MAEEGSERRPQRRQSKRPERYRHADDEDDEGSNVGTSQNDEDAAAADAGENNSDGEEDSASSDGEDEKGTAAIAAPPKSKKKPIKHELLSGTKRKAADDVEDDDSNEEGDEELGEEPAGEDDEEEEDDGPQAQDDQATPTKTTSRTRSNSTTSTFSNNNKTPPPGRECRIPHCNKYKKAKSEGYCQEHFKQYGNPLSVQNSLGKGGSAPPGRECRVEGCAKYRKAKCEGYCLTCFRSYAPEVGGSGHVGVYRGSSNGVGGDGDEGEEEFDEEYGNVKEGAPPPLLPPGLGLEESVSKSNGPTSSPPPAPSGSKATPKKTPSSKSNKPPETTTPTTPPANNTTSTTTTPPSSKSSKYCAHPSCTKYRQTSCYGYCLTHKHLSDPTLHQTKRIVASYTSQIKKKTTNKSNLCKWTNCNKYIQSNCNGYCLTHVKFANFEEEDEEDVVKVRVRLMGRLQNGFCQAIIGEVGWRERWGFHVVDGSMVGGDGGVEGGGVGGGEKGVVKEEEMAEKSDMDVEREEGVDDQKPAAAVGASDMDMEDDQSPSTIKEEENDQTSTTDTSQTTPTKQPPQSNKDPASLLHLLDFPISATPQKKSNGATKCKALSCPKNSQGNSHGFCRAHHNRYLICTGQCDSWRCVCGEQIVSFQSRCGSCHRWRGGKHAMNLPGGNSGLDSNVVRASIMAGNAINTDAGGGANVKAEDGVPADIAAASGYSSGARTPQTYVPPDASVQISTTPRTNDKGRSLCKVIGCNKMDQTNNDGFCRMHFNMFAVLDETSEDALDSWTCSCGAYMSGRNKRCGVCNKWRGGKREAYTVTKNLGISTDNILQDDGNGGESHWTCDCGNTVPSSKARCGRCHHWRGGRRQGGWKLGSGFAAGEYDSDDGIDRTVDWTCCGMTIPARQTRCGKCNGWRGGKRVPSAVTREAVERNIPPWECGKCRISNPGAKKRCGGCLAWKGTGGGRTGGSGKSSSSGGNRTAADASGGNANWSCKKCNIENFPTELQCFMCRGMRPNWQYHKRQMGDPSTNGDTTPVGYPGAGTTSTTTGAAASANPYSSVSAPAQTNCATSDDHYSDWRYYYGKLPDNVSYPYISIHYDFNRSYYRNHDYTYLTGGICQKAKIAAAAAAKEGNAGSEEQGGTIGGSISPTTGASEDGGTTSAIAVDKASVAGTTNDIDKLAEEITSKDGAVTSAATAAPVLNC